MRSSRSLAHATPGRAFEGMRPRSPAGFLRGPRGKSGLKLWGQNSTTSPGYLRSGLGNFSRDFSSTRKAECRISSEICPPTDRIRQAPWGKEPRPFAEEEADPPRSTVFRPCRGGCRMENPLIFEVYKTVDKRATWWIITEDADRRRWTEETGPSRPPEGTDLTNLDHHRALPLAFECDSQAAFRPYRYISWALAAVQAPATKWLRGGRSTLFLGMLVNGFPESADAVPGPQGADPPIKLIILAAIETGGQLVHQGLLKLYVGKHGWRFPPLESAARGARKTAGPPHVKQMYSTMLMAEGPKSWFHWGTTRNVPRSTKHG